MLEAYQTNAAMRATYYRMNKITHAEVWDTDNGYKVALCSDEGVGFPEQHELATVGQCYAWCRRYCPELAVKG